MESSVARMIAQRYTRALFASAGASGPREALGKELAAFDSLLDQRPEFRASFQHPGISVSAKLELALSAAANGSELFKRFLNLLVVRRRMDLLPYVRTAYEELLLEAQGVQPVLVITSHPLRAELVDRMQQRLSLFLGKTAQLKVHIDPSVLGGVKLKYGDREIDATLKTKLNRLSKLLSE